MSKDANTDVKFAGSLNGELVPIYKLGASFKVDYLVTSVASAATITAATGLTRDQICLRVIASTDCFITFAAAPTALADGTHHRLQANRFTDIRVLGTDKVAAIRATADGSLYCTALV